MGAPVENMPSERPSAAWMQFVVEAFEDVCADKGHEGLSFRATTVVLRPGREVDGHAGQFPLGVVLMMKDVVYPVLVGRGAHLPRFLAEVLRAVLMIPVEEPVETELWSTPGAAVKQMYSAPVAGCFADDPDALARAVAAVIRDDWRGRFGDDDGDDTNDPKEPQPPSVDVPRPTALVR